MVYFKNFNWIRSDIQTHQNRGFMTPQERARQLLDSIKNDLLNSNLFDQNSIDMKSLFRIETALQDAERRGRDKALEECAELIGARGLPSTDEIYKKIQALRKGASA